MGNIRKAFVAGTAFVLALGVLTMLGCGGDSTAPAPTINGTYDLKTVNGANLPFTDFQDATSKEEITSDVVTASNGSMTELTTFRETVNGQVSIQTSSDAGTYVINGTAVSFAFTSGATGTGTVSGNTFTVAESGISLFYVHR